MRREKETSYWGTTIDFTTNFSRFSLGIFPCSSGLGRGNRREGLLRRRQRMRGGVGLRFFFFQLY